MNHRIAVAITLLCMLAATAFPKADGQITPDASRDNMDLAKLNAIIKAPDSDRKAKSGAVFDLFSNYVQLPATAADAARVFLEPSWIDSAGIRVPPGVVGRIPITRARGETLYIIDLYPHPDGSSEYVIYLTLTGAQLQKKDLIALLKGQPDQGGAHFWRAFAISEFALCGVEKENNESRCRRFPEISTPVGEDQAQRIATNFVERHNLRIEDYKPPAGRWADASRQVRQFCFELKEEKTPTVAYISPRESFCVEVEMVSGRSSFFYKQH